MIHNHKEYLIKCENPFLFSLFNNIKSSFSICPMFYISRVTENKIFLKSIDKNKSIDIYLNENVLIVEKSFNIKDLKGREIKNTELNKTIFEGLEKYKLNIENAKRKDVVSKIKEKTHILKIKNSNKVKERKSAKFILTESYESSVDLTNFNKKLILKSEIEFRNKIKVSEQTLDFILSIVDKNMTFKYLIDAPRIEGFEDLNDILIFENEELTDESKELIKINYKT